MKKFMLAGAAGLVGIAGLVGGGTFAQFTDEEVTPAQSVSTGSVDIEFTDATASNSAIAFPLDVQNAQPGATNPTQYIHVLNSGSLPVSIQTLLKKVADDDNTCTEPETVAEADCATDTDGELDSVMTLNINGFVNGGDTLSALAVGAEALVNGPSQSGADSIFNLAPGEDRWLSVDYEIPLSAGNEIQTDTVQWEVLFKAAQV